MDKFDMIIAGSGTAGSVTAIRAARAGLRVGLLDLKARADIGKKICGDAVGKHHFDSLGLDTPRDEEVERMIEGIKIYSPDEKTAYVVKGESLYGYILNRHRFGQRLVKEAVDAGAVLYDRTRVLEPIVERGFVRGVSARSADIGEAMTLRSSVVVEATGYFARIRKKLMPELGIDVQVDNRDVEACYREIRQLRKPVSESALCQIYIAQEKTPGGYYWIFPEGGSKVNVGLGVAMAGKFPNPKGLLYRHVLSRAMFQGSSIVDKGAWYVPTRRPLDNMVANGLIVVGDAACQVNPIHGGGMGPSMIGGALAAETAAKALGNGDVSSRALWEYNVGYMRDYGAKQAGLEIFRILLQNMDDAELNYGMRHRLLTEEELLKASMGEDVRFTVSEKARIALKGVKKVGLLRKLRKTSKLMREVKAWYRSYPKSPDGFEGWRAGVKKLLSEASKKLER